MNQDVFSLKTIVAAIVFAAIGVLALIYAPEREIGVVLNLLLLTVFLFAFEIVGVDVAAVSIMVLLGLLSHFGHMAGLPRPLVNGDELFSGFASNAVISIIAVMIIGAGLDKTGLMSKVAAAILKVAGNAEARIIPAVSGTVGIISSFMQNVGAAALFLPVVGRIAARTGLPLPRLLMPMGFCAILGGTITMVGSSPLILLNDLMMTSNKALPAEHHMEAWSLFSVTPIGLVLLASGIVYFIFFGRYVLPGVKGREAASGGDAMDYYKKLYGLDYAMRELEIAPGSALIGMQLNDIEGPFRLRVIALLRGADDLRIGPGGVARDVGLEAGSVVGLLGAPDKLDAFARHHGLQYREQLQTFADVLSPAKSGIAEVVIPPASSLVNKSARDVWMRKTYGIALVALHRGGSTLREGDGIRDMPLQAGDALVVHCPWDALAKLQKDRNFVVITTEFPHEESRQHKVKPALLFFAVALFMLLFTDVRLSVALLTGAVGMILSGVLRIEEAYQAVSWKTVFLLASLIPLGLAVETSGTAAWIARQTLDLIGHMPIWVLQTAIAVLATAFTLVMSNVGATVLLVPLAVNIAIGAGAEPAIFALTVALATSNSFFLPTHQVNALIMGPAGYRVADFMRAGGVMTLLFLVVLIPTMNLVL